MRRALQEKYPRKKVRAWDCLLVTRDPWAKQTVVIIDASENLHCYHVPTWELPGLAFALLREFGVSGVAEWFYLLITGRRGKRRDR